LKLLLLLRRFARFLQGILLLTLQAHNDRLKPPTCGYPFDPTCQKVHGNNKVHLNVALYLISIGSAGIKAALPAHCADQFDEKHPVEKLQMSSCFNWLLLSLCTGGVISCTVFVWIQNYEGWDRGFGAATGVMGLPLIVFVAGLPRYRFTTVQGNTALLEIFQVRKRFFSFALPFFHVERVRCSRLYCNCCTCSGVRCCNQKQEPSAP
jgi:solute carrier family 15 (peptide/histidine transporter), member 3/4